MSSNQSPTAVYSVPVFVTPTKRTIVQTDQSVYVFSGPQAEYVRIELLRLGAEEGGGQNQTTHGEALGDAIIERWRNGTLCRRGRGDGDGAALPRVGGEKQWQRRWWQWW